MTQQQRLLLAMALSFGVIMLYTNFVTNPALEEAAKKAAAADAGFHAADLDGGGVAVIAAASPAPAPTPAAAAVADAGAVAPVPEVPARLVELERPSMKLTFTSEGAGLTDAVLRGTRERGETDLSIVDGYRKLLGATFPLPAHIDLAEPLLGGAPQFAISIAGPNPLAATQRYAVVRQEAGLLEFVATAPPYEVHKVFRWSPEATTSEVDPKGYLWTLELTVKNLAPTAVGGELSVHTSRFVPSGAEQAPSYFGGIGNQSQVVCQSGDDTERWKPKDDDTKHEAKGNIGFVGIDQPYFLTAIWQREGAVSGRCTGVASNTTRLAELIEAVSLQPGQTLTKSYDVFTGPKDLKLLTSVPKSTGDAFDPRLEKTVDFNLWAAICRILIFVMRLFHNLTGNWGVAIILLTVSVKILLLPLTHKAMVSAEQMKKLSPRLEEIKKKHPDDRDKQNMEMMKLYQEAKVNPLGGCLPLLLQLPIWGALFTTLRASYELYGQPFWGVWSDLTSKDPTYILPLAQGITMIVTQRLQPQMTMDKTQQVLMSWVMPIFFTAVMMNYPAGLSLYIFTNNLLSIIQQYALRKYLARSGGAAR